MLNIEYEVYKPTERRQDYNLKKEFLRAYKEEKGCAICGLDISEALDFHHLDPQAKEFTISSSRKGIIKTMEEVEKCIVLCANHHRMYHAGLVKLNTPPPML